MDDESGDLTHEKVWWKHKHASQRQGDWNKVDGEN